MGFVSGRGAKRFAPAALALAAAAAYADGLRGPFVFDDTLSTVANPTIRRWSTAFFPPGHGATVQGRPLLNLSFAVNWHLSGGAVWSYHLLNLLIHIAAACVLYGLIRRSLVRLPAWRDGGDGPAFVVALLWAVHPLQTEAVTYVAQRAESLMGLCYLATLYGFARYADPGANPGRRRLWAALCIIACFLGMGAKEVMVSAPVIVLLFDRTFWAGSFRDSWRLHRRVHLALAATWLPLLILVLGTGTRGATSGFGLGVPPFTYYATQFRALGQYLHLAFWPAPLIFDYGTQWVHSARDLVPYAALVLLLAAATAVALRRRPAAGFLGVFCFAILSVTSLIPGTRQTSAEQRMYLPLAAVLTLAVCAGDRAARGRRSRYLSAAAFLAAPLAAATLRRNLDYRSAIRLYTDTVAKLPTNAFARYNLGKTLDESGHPELAVPQYQAAVRLDPGMNQAYLNLGNSLGKVGRLADAEAAYRSALRLNPNYERAHYELGILCLREGRKSEAEAQFNDAVLLHPNDSDARDNLGGLLLEAGRLDDARAQFETVERQGSASVQTHYNLGVVDLLQHRPADARGEFGAALRLDPAFTPARERLRALAGDASPER